MKVLNKEIPEELILKIIKDVKNKPELRNINENFVKNLLQKELEKNSKLIEFLVKHQIKNINRSEKYKKLIKTIRAILHITYGVFLTKEAKKIKQLMLNLKEAINKATKLTDTIEEHKAVLCTHKSTKERLQIYPKLYSQIWQITGEPKRIIDLASGLNPLSFPWMGLNFVSYFATELNKEDCDLINDYFSAMKKFNLHGQAVQLDLQQVLKEPELLKSLPNSDVCFLFKVLDTIELTKSHKISQIIISTVPAKWIIASFPTKTLGKKANMPTKRLWLEKMCAHLGYQFKMLIFDNESFYIINTFKKL